MWKYTLPTCYHRFKFKFPKIEYDPTLVFVSIR